MLCDRYVSWSTEQSSVPKPGALDESAKSYNSVTADEKIAADQLIKDDNNVKLIPETPNTGQSYDFEVNGIPTELKTLNGSNINTVVTKVGRALRQLNGDGAVLYDISKAGFTAEQIAEIMQD